MNTIIGRWTEESKSVKKNLTHYIFEEKAGIIAQLAGLPHHKDYLNHPRYWEYATALELTNPNNISILDVGGLNNVVGWYLRDKHGCTVSQVGLDPQDLNGFNANCTKFGATNINGQCKDIRDCTFDEQFDIVYSFNVIEHVREYAKAEKDKKWKMGSSAYWGQSNHTEDYAEQKEIEFVKACARWVKPGGLLCITFDFTQHGGWRPQKKCAYMRNAEDIHNRIIKSSELTVVGNIDYDKVYPVDSNPPASTGLILLKKEI